MPVTRSHHRRPRFLSWPGAAPPVSSPSVHRVDQFIEEVNDAPSSPKIPRPKNSFILFRNEWIQTHKRGSAHHCQDPDAPSLSRQAGTAWRALSASERRPWEVLAEKEKAEHARLYPHYRFRPVKRPSMRIATSQQKSQSHPTPSTSTNAGTASDSRGSTPSTPTSYSSEDDVESSQVHQTTIVPSITTQASGLANVGLSSRPDRDLTALSTESSKQLHRAGYYQSYPRFSLTPELCLDSGTSEGNISTPPALLDQSLYSGAARRTGCTISSISSLAGWDGQVAESSATAPIGYSNTNPTQHERGYLSEPSTPWDPLHIHASGFFDPSTIPLNSSWQSANPHYDQLAPIDTPFSTLELNPGGYAQLPYGF